MATHYDIVHLTEVGSTQDEATARFDGTGMPTLVVADRQVKGRGRQGRTWEQPDRAMFSSVSFDIDWEPARRTLVPLITGLVVSESVVRAGGLETGLKWPNDILVGSLKAGGVLVELEGDRMTVGCGLNLWWADPIEDATSAFASDPGTGAASDLANDWVSALLGEVARGPGSWREADYLSACVTVGQSVEWVDGRGRAVGIDDSGALVVETADGTVTIHAGDVHLRG